jgi:hypothetical protein
VLSGTKKEHSSFATNRNREPLKVDWTMDVLAVVYDLDVPTGDEPVQRG